MWGDEGCESEGRAKMVAIELGISVHSEMRVWRNPWMPRPKYTLPEDRPARHARPAGSMPPPTPGLQNDISASRWTCRFPCRTKSSHRNNTSTQNVFACMDTNHAYRLGGRAQRTSKGASPLQQRSRSRPTESDGAPPSSSVCPCQRGRPLP